MPRSRLTYALAYAMMFIAIGIIAYVIWWM